MSDSITLVHVGTMTTKKSQVIMAPCYYSITSNILYYYNMKLT